ncbi:MAG: thioredoxin domain-containing protein [Terricaulis sp.]
MRRRNLLIGAAALASLAACGGAGGATGTSPDDMAYGPANAAVTLVEYMSVACPICRQFHETVFNEIKTKYVDTGKLRLILREVPTHDAHVALGGFQIARCGGATADQYLARVSVMFQQQDILDGQSRQASDDKLFEIGRSAGLTDDQLNTCVNDAAGGQRLQRNSDALSAKYGQTWGTPLLELNGTRLTDQTDYTVAGLSAKIDAALAAAAHH